MKIEWQFMEKWRMRLFRKPVGDFASLPGPDTRRQTIPIDASTVHALLRKFAYQNQFTSFVNSIC